MDDFLYSNSVKTPENINIYPGITSVSASWDLNPSVDNYNVRISGGSVNITDYVDRNRVFVPSGLSPNTDYTISITAYSGVIPSRTLTKNFRTLTEPIFQSVPVVMEETPSQPPPVEEIDPCVCSTDIDCFNCPYNNLCSAGRCVECIDKCMGGKVCNDGMCVNCMSDLECGDGFICGDGTCRSKPENQLPLIIGITISGLILLFFIIYLFLPHRTNFDNHNIM